MSAEIRVFSMKGISTRKFILPAPMPVDGLFWGVQINKQEVEDEKTHAGLRAVNNFLYHKDWLREMAKRIVQLEGVYSFTSYTPQEIEISLQTEFRWDTVTIDEKHGEATIKQKVQTLLAEHLQKTREQAFAELSFPNCATRCKTLAGAH